MLNYSARYITVFRMQKTVNKPKAISRSKYKFQISIKDSFDNFQYELQLPDVSPYDIVKTICKKYKVDFPKPKWIGPGFKTKLRNIE